MNEHLGRRRLLNAFKSKPYGILPLRSPCGRRQQFGVAAEFAHGLAIGVDIIAVDNDAHRIDLRMRQESLRRPRQDGAPRQHAVLLGSAGAGAGTATRGDNDSQPFLIRMLLQTLPAVLSSKTHLFMMSNERTVNRRRRF